MTKSVALILGKTKTNHINIITEEIRVNIDFLTDELVNYTLHAQIVHITTVDVLIFEIIPAIQRTTQSKVDLIPI